MRGPLYCIGKECTLNCYWCGDLPPCAHRTRETEEEGLAQLRALTKVEQLKIKWVRWFHTPVMPERRWCNCGMPYPCKTRLDVIGWTSSGAG